MIEALKVMGFAKTSLLDFSGNQCVYLPVQCLIPANVMKKLLPKPLHHDPYGLLAMEEEIEATLNIENIASSRESVRKILRGKAPANEEESRVYGIKRGLDFISNPANQITEENLYRLYMLAAGEFPNDSDKLPSGHFYRNDNVFLVGDKPVHRGLTPSRLPAYMEAFIHFANQEDDIPELTKACMLHFQLAHLHPWFDGNGRTARLLHMWYLVKNGFPSTLHHTFSRYIMLSRKAYYQAFVDIRDNLAVSGILDMTPFIRYFRDSVYTMTERHTASSISTEPFVQLLAEGKVTEKERDLWFYILSTYGTTPFSTKQLEKDFGNAAYATIRTFVLKFSETGLLSKQSFGSRVKYMINADD